MSGKGWEGQPPSRNFCYGLDCRKWLTVREVTSPHPREVQKQLLGSRLYLVDARPPRKVGQSPPTFNSMICALNVFIYGLITGINCSHTFWFGFPNLGERGPLWGWAFLVSDGASLSSYRSHYKAIRCLHVMV